MTTSTPNEAREQYLSFTVAGEEFAINILRVKEIIEFGTLTRVPGMPPSVAGVINLRGGVVPVVDLAVRFGLPASGVTKRSCIVVLEVSMAGEPVVMGIISDAVSQVLDLGTSDIAPPPGFGSHVRAEYLQGMAEAGASKKFVMLLDIDRTLAADELLAGLTTAALEIQPATEADAA